MIPVSEAIGFLHGHGTIHLDLKPANILLDAAFDPWVADFGLVWDRLRAAFQQHPIAGTKAYFSPQLAAEYLACLRNRQPPAYTPKEPDDIYALGLILFELLTGDPLFNRQGLTDEELFDQIRQGRPRHIHNANAAVPRSLRDVVQRCLEPDPAKRPQTGEELAENLRKSLTTLVPGGAPGTFNNCTVHFGMPVVAAAGQPQPTRLFVTVDHDFTVFDENAQREFVQRLSGCTGSDPLFVFFRQSKEA